MKKIILNSLIVIIFLFTFVSQVFCYTVKFNNSYISDDAKIIGQTYTPVLDNILKNLKKDTGVDFLVITIDSFNGTETYKAFEEKLLVKYPIGGNNYDNYVIVLFTKYPFDIYISRGKKLEKVIPKTMIRAFKIEMWMEKLFGGFGKRRNRIEGQQTATVNSTNYRFNNSMASLIVYSMSVALADTVAQEFGKNLYYRNDLYIMGMLVNGEYSTIPHTNPVLQFIRRYDLYPAIFVLIIGILPYYFRRRHRRIRRTYSRIIDFFGSLKK